MSPFAALRVWLNIMETVLTEKHNTMCHPSLRSGSGSTDAEIQSSRSEPALERSEGVTASGFVILSAAKDLWPACVQPAASRGLADFWRIKRPSREEEAPLEHLPI
ncbi:MAG: hypothetical protein E6J48_00885 [Chloroflexi bacterium]|nr:MAG: hypothetical protein E6J48_00885 [Chloroflexota bacterium]